ncbi:hypothetical protein G7051_12135 [Dysgonomonas sp. HDW5B]|uniref:hypothetical protein n=1 Tax=Dysgonomonas sp. HDW5B TaxID=2714927 RepID=UPI0014093209|nr:hypothetical protein [Dysgonomonas sp. HDW5B]QIK55048.1 hypothetical protein G7051_12135 [Dysgonomonas sp. HDW5B]
MKTDVYTKIVLTVIAIFLGLNFFKEIEIIPTVKANTTATAQTSQPTAIKNETVDVNISHLGGVPITNYLPSYPETKAMKEFNLFYYEGLPVTIMKNRDK